MTKPYAVALAVFVAILSLLPSPLAASAAGDSPSPDVLEQVRRTLDDICPDTFCGGDINYRVVDVTCDFGAALCAVTLDFELFGAGGADVPRRYTCELGGYRNTDDIAVARAGGRLRYSDRLYDDLLDCLDESVELLMPTIAFTRDLDLFGRTVPVNVPVACAGHADLPPFFSDYFYALDFKRNSFAVIAYFDYVTRYAATNDCTLSTVRVDARRDVACIDEPVSYPVCEVDLGADRAYVFKDFVDSTSAALVSSAPGPALPPTWPWIDGVDLYLPEVEPCREALLDGFSQTSRLEAVDARPWASYYDMRFVASTAIRAVVGDLARADSQCQYEPTTRPASDMVCKDFPDSGARLCTIESLGGGYFQVLATTTGEALVGFSNFD